MSWSRPREGVGVALFWQRPQERVRERGDVGFAAKKGRVFGIETRDAFCPLSKQCSEFFLREICEGSIKKVEYCLKMEIKGAISTQQPLVVVCYQCERLITWEAVSIDVDKASAFFAGERASVAEMRVRKVESDQGKERGEDIDVMGKMHSLGSLHGGEM